MGLARNADWAKVRKTAWVKMIHPARGRVADLAWVRTVEWGGAHRGGGETTAHYVLARARVDLDEG